MTPPPVRVEHLSFRYGERLALNDVSFDLPPGSIFGLLGPNGGGKTTLFRILCTLLPPQEGSASILGLDVRTQPDAVRRVIGVTFQSPSLDIKLTVLENLLHHGRLFGLSGAPLRERCDSLLERMKLADRARDLVETLSGGLKRRVEIAKGLIHDPRVLLLDEPSTGLDPGARIDLWQYLEQLRRESAMTVLVTTHLMDEAERCDRLGILSRGRLVALGTPAELRESVGGDTVTIQSADAERLAAKIRERFAVDVRMVAGSLRIEHAVGHELVRDLMAAFPDEVSTVTFGKPTLEDVFIQKTGHRFWEEDEPEPPKRGRRR